MIKKNKRVLAALLCCCVYDASFCMEANHGISQTDAKERVCHRGVPVRGASARKFTSYEDEIILACIISLNGAQPNWSDIARGLPDHTVKQVKERYSQLCLDYSFAPEQSRVSWTQEEDAILIEKRRELGKRWGGGDSKIPSRT